MNCEELRYDFEPGGSATRSLQNKSFGSSHVRVLNHLPAEMWGEPGIIGRWCVQAAYRWMMVDGKPAAETQSDDSRQFHQTVIDIYQNHYLALQFH